jgi:hypothetical protein
MSLLQRYREASAAVEAEADDDRANEAFDAAAELELEAESELRDFVKMATRQDLSRPVRHAVAAYLDDSLVVVARDSEDSSGELLLVIDRKHIARGG